MFSFCGFNLQQHDVQNSRAKMTDCRSSLRGLRRPLGGLSPPSPSLVTSLHGASVVIVPDQTSWCRWHLSVLNIICHLASHFCKLLRSDWRMLVSWVVLIRLYKRQITGQMRKRLVANRRGPRTVPCGTPLITVWGDEVDPSQRTLWVLFDKNAGSAKLLPACLALSVL